MAYSRTDILRAIDRSLYASRRASDNPALEEELARRERNLKSEQALDLLEFLPNLDPAEEWNRILEQASHYPIETLGLSQRSYHGLVTYGIYHIRTEIWETKALQRLHRPRTNFWRSCGAKARDGGSAAMRRGILARELPCPKFSEKLLICNRSPQIARRRRSPALS